MCIHFYYFFFCVCESLNGKDNNIGTDAGLCGSMISCNLKIQYRNLYINGAVDANLINLLTRPEIYIQWK